jgi:hypothetical protein
MSKARAGKEIHAIADNKIGTLSDICQWLADKGINIKSVCAYLDNGKAHFLFVTSDNKKAIEVLRAKDLQASEEEAVVVEMNDKVGTLKDMAKKLKSVDVDINYIYATTAGTAHAPATVIFKSSDNAKAILTING